MSIKQIRDALSHHVETVGKSKDGKIVVRRGFYYTNGGSAEKFAAMVTSRLQAAGVPAKVVDQGEQWKAFRGSATTAQSSHWWAKIEVNA